MKNFEKYHYRFENKQSNSKHTLFIKLKEGKVIVLTAYVDNMILAK